ncbi:MAG: fibronectin type III domain-containing protein [Terrimicrobiaceae bacterium]
MLPLIAASVLLVWDASPVPDVVLYRLYVGIQSLRAGNPPLTGYSTQKAQFQVDGLDYGTDYFFCVTAINLAGLESEYSNEVQYTPTPAPEPTPKPGKGFWSY